MIRKFFDPSVAEPAAAVQEPVSVAQLMARQGSLNSTGEQRDLPPVEIQEKKEEPSTAQTGDSPVETTTDSSPKAETANPESQQSIAEPAKVQEPQIAAEPTKVPDWQEVLKSQQPDSNAVLKELGFDDKVVSLAKELQDNPKILNLFKHWKEKGDVVAYMKELSTDYSKMPAEEVMRHQLRKEYPTASEAAINALYKREVVNAYNLNSEDEVEAEEGRLLLEAKADRYRSELTKNQQEYLLPPPPEPQQVVQDNSEQLRREADQQLYVSRVSDHSYTKDIIDKKTISIGQGENKVTIPVEPQKLLDFWFDTKNYAENLFDVKDVNGRIDLVPKVEKQLRAAAYILYEDQLLDAYAKHFKSLGGEKAIEPIQNAKQPDGSTASQSEPKFDNPAAAMAKQGRINSGGYGY